MFRNANGELKSTVEIIEILRKKTDGMGGHSAVAF